MLLGSGFNDIKNPSLPDLTGRVAGTQFMNDLREMSVGTGSQVVRADESGLWAGANKFANAPFKVDMQGNIYIESADGKLVIDAVNNRIVIYDASGTARVLLGYQANGF